jgi:hypothetical protein
MIPVDRENRDGLTIGVRYEKAKHRTHFTVRFNGRVLDHVTLHGEYDERRIKRTIREIRERYRRG